MANQQLDNHVQNWAIHNLGEATQNGMWMETNDGDFAVVGPHGRVDRYRKLILDSSELATEDQVQVKITGGSEAVDNGDVPLSWVASQLTVSKELGRNSQFHSDLKKASSQFADASHQAAKQNIVDLLAMSFTMEPEEWR